MSNDKTAGAPGEEFGGYGYGVPITLREALKIWEDTPGDWPVTLTIRDRRCAYCKGPRADERECPSCGATRIEE